MWIAAGIAFGSYLAEFARNYVTTYALLSSERLRRSPLVDHKCILQIADYGRSARARILYNHIFFSDLPESYRRALVGDNFYEKILGQPAVVKSVLERWEETVPNFEETTSILGRMEDETWVKTRLDPGLYGSIRAQMFAELEHAYSFYDFMHVQEFLKQTDTAATDEENKVISSSFQRYLRSRFSEDLSEITSDGDALDDMANFMSEMITEYGYNISREYARVMSTIGVRDEYAERGTDEDGRWKDERNLERADEEAISSMFDSLR
jgi:hypothetical protein